MRRSSASGSPETAAAAGRSLVAAGLSRSFGSRSVLHEIDVSFGPG